jgi:para-nitrobenzyl esterase
MAGSDSDEASGYAKPTTADAFTAQARRRYGDKADTFLKMYPAGSDQEANQSQTLSASDLAGAYDARAFVQLQTRTGKAKSYLYLFSHKPPVTAPDIKVYDGVFHGAELYYLFQTYSFRNDWAWTDADRKLGDIVTSYWVNFAATGDPNGKGLPKWPAYDDTAEKLMNFGDKVSVETVPHKAALDFFESFLHPQEASSSRTSREETR